MESGSSFSSRTRLADMSTVMGSPFFLHPAISPDHSPFSRIVCMMRSASDSDWAKTVADLPMMSEGSSPPHIFRAAAFT